MALDYNRLASMPQDEALAYLREQFSGGIGPIQPTMITGGEGAEGGFVSPYVPHEIGLLQRGAGVNPEDYSVTFESPYGPDQAYLAQFSPDGQLRDVMLQPKSSWTETEVLGLPIGPFLPIAAAAAASYLPQAFGAEAAGAAGGGSEALIGGAADDLLLGEVLKDTAGLDKLIFQSAAKDAALQAGLSQELAAVAAEVAGGLSGSGMSMADAIASGMSAATSGASTGLVSSAGTIIGGGGALTPGLPGMLTGTSGASLLTTLASGARDVWNTGKDLYKTVAPVASAGKKLYDAVTGSGSGSGSGTSSGGLGGLGGIGGILGLALLMAQLRKDRNAPAANATPVIPRLRSRVEQKPFTLDAQGNKQAPLAYFGQPVYYAAGGGIGGLAAGGQASRAVRGPGDGVSDSIPARINGEEPAALADGEFVIDARTVAELGNGSTEAGTRKLEAMVNRVHHARAKARRGEDSGADRHMPA